MRRCLSLFMVLLLALRGLLGDAMAMQMLPIAAPTHSANPARHAAPDVSVRSHHGTAETASANASPHPRSTPHCARLRPWRPQRQQHALQHLRPVSRCVVPAHHGRRAPWLAHRHAAPSTGCGVCQRHAAQPDQTPDCLSVDAQSASSTTP